MLCSLSDPGSLQECDAANLGHHNSAKEIKIKCLHKRVRACLALTPHQDGMTGGPDISDLKHSGCGRARSLVMCNYVEDLCTPMGVMRSDVEPMLDCLAAENP
jgi:hypothetical protein